MRAPRHYCQLSSDLSESTQGRLFVHPSTAEVVDLSSINIVHFATDTVRQLYRGKIRDGVLDVFDEKDGLVEFAGHSWHAGRIGRDSGYQYRLQNADLGIILLIKSFHAPVDQDGPHLKIEVSPHCILERSTSGLQVLLDHLADCVLFSPEKSQCAVHVALDVQGWQPPDDFEARMHCRSRRVRRFTGAETVDFYSGAAVYGRGETYMFGSAAGVQLCVYDKTLEAKAKDKLDFWVAVWERSGFYDPAKRVTRIEFRFHHSVIQQFADGTADLETGEVISTEDYEGLYPFLTGIFRYGLDNFRFLNSPAYFDPLWTFLRGQSLHDGKEPAVDYRRYYKSASGFSGKNVELLLGNFVSLAARHRMSANLAWKALKQLPFFEVIEDHYKGRGKENWQLKQHLSKLISERYLKYGMAV